MRGEQKKNLRNKIGKSYTQQIQTELPIGARCIVAPKDRALLGVNGNTLKLKTTAKLNSKKPRSPRSQTYTECMPLS
jgi:hypothetical protein